MTTPEQCNTCEGKGKRPFTAEELSKMESIPERFVTNCDCTGLQQPQTMEERFDEQLEILEHLILGNAHELVRDENSPHSKATISEMKKFIKGKIIALAVQQERENNLSEFENFLYDNLGTDQKSGEIAFAFKDFKNLINNQV